MLTTNYAIFSAMQSSSLSLRVGEGKRIKTEVLSQSPPIQSESCGVSFMSVCPKEALLFYTQNLYLFMGLLYKHPGRRSMYEPMIRELNRKISELEARISNVNNPT